MGCTSSASSGVAKVVPFTERYALEQCLAYGSLGQVRICQDLKTKERLAVKVSRSGSLKHVNDTANEQLVWTRLGSHKHVVNLIECFNDNLACYFVMELCERSLFEYLNAQETTSRDGCLCDAFRQVLLGLHHCHSKRIVHRDIKDANLRLGSDGNAKIMEFGSSSLLPEKGLLGIVGADPYLSPEMVLGRLYDCKTDVWSCGVTAYLFLYGQYPYHPRECAQADGEMNSKQIRRAIAANVPEPTFTALDQSEQPSAGAQNLVKALLQRSASLRPKAVECLHLCK